MLLADRGKQRRFIHADADQAAPRRAALEDSLNGVPAAKENADLYGALRRNVANLNAALAVNSNRMLVVNVLGLWAQLERVARVEQPNLKLSIAPVFVSVWRSDDRQRELRQGHPLDAAPDPDDTAHYVEFVGLHHACAHPMVVAS